MTGMLMSVEVNCQRSNWQRRDPGKPLTHEDDVEAIRLIANSLDGLLPVLALGDVAIPRLLQKRIQQSEV
jgi:hypothetical protein